jgi:hypothetical protein
MLSVLCRFEGKYVTSAVSWTENVMTTATYIQSSCNKGYNIISFPKYLKSILPDPPPLFLTRTRRSPRPSHYTHRLIPTHALPKNPTPNTQTLAAAATAAAASSWIAAASAQMITLRRFAEASRGLSLRLLAASRSCPNQSVVLAHSGVHGHSGASAGRGVASPSELHPARASASMELRPGGGGSSGATAHRGVASPSELHPARASASMELRPGRGWSSDAVAHRRVASPSKVHPGDAPAHRVSAISKLYRASTSALTTLSCPMVGGPIGAQQQKRTGAENLVLHSPSITVATLPQKVSPASTLV